MIESLIPTYLLKYRALLKKHFTKKGYTVSFDKPLNQELPYQFHMLCKKNFETIAIDIREKCSLERYFENAINEIQACRFPTKIYIAIPEDFENKVNLTQINELEKKSIGLIIIKQKTISEKLKTISCARKFVLEPGTSLGKHKISVENIIKEYNNGNCISAIRELCDLVEEESIKLAIKASKKNKINLIPQDIIRKAHTWDHIINALSSSDFRGMQQTRYFDNTISNEIRSFKDVRNLSDHWKTYKERKQLDRKLFLSMMQGIDLIREIIKIKKKV